MSIFEKNKHLFGKKIKVVCNDGEIYFGLWSEIWDKEDNYDTMTEQGREVCESILVDVGNIPMEFEEPDVKSIEEVK